MYIAIQKDYLHCLRNNITYIFISLIHFIYILHFIYKALKITHFLFEQFFINKKLYLLNN